MWGWGIFREFLKLNFQRTEVSRVSSESTSSIDLISSALPLVTLINDANSSSEIFPQTEICDQSLFLVHQLEVFELWLPLISD